MKFNFQNDTLTATTTGSYTDGVGLANITIAGIKSRPAKAVVTVAGQPVHDAGVILHHSGPTLYLTGLESATKNGVWDQTLEVQLL